MESGSRPVKKKNQPKKIRKFTQGKLTPEEYKRRMMQREAALTRRFSSASSPSIAPAVRNAGMTLRGTREVLLALSDPANAEPFRLPGGGRATFVNKLKYVQASAVEPAVLNFTPNSGFAIARRDPRCAVIHSQYVAFPGCASTYSMYGPKGLTPLVAADGFLVLGAGELATGFARHDAAMAPWVFADGRTRLWMQNEVANPGLVAYNGAPVSTPVTLTIDVLFNGVNTTISATSTSNGTGQGTFSVVGQFNGYCAFKISVTAAPLVGLSVQANFTDNSQSIFRHRCVPGFWDNYTTIDTLRINAMSLMFSDRTAENYSQGNIVAYQAAGGDDWGKLLNTSVSPTSQGMDPYSSVASNNQSYKGAYKKGRYIPLKFVDDPREQQMLLIADDSEIYEVLPILAKDQMDYIYIGWNIGTLVSGAPMGEITCWSGCEGETESQWLETCVPHLHPDVLKEAKWAFSQITCDFENPNHLRKIWDWVKKNAPRILDIVDFAGSVAPPQYRAGIAAGTTIGRTALKALEGIP